MDQRIRHPEKEHKPDNPVKKKPDWIRVKAPNSQTFQDVQSLMRSKKLLTVCEEASCPNIGECWAKKHATFMIMGGVCTRGCTFCNVATGKPDGLDSFEPYNVAQAVKTMGLEHVVVTSVDRDDLEDGGAEHFFQTITAIREASPQTTIEVLTPDFLRKGTSWSKVVQAEPEVFNHNIETVPRLYTEVRPGSRYFQSLHLLKSVKDSAPDRFTKSGLMVGLGETKEEVFQVMDDLRAAEVDFLTIGQYLQPTPKHHIVDRFVHPDEFKEYKEVALGKGFLLAACSPLTRSSYHAGDDFKALQKARVLKQSL